jgi:16S rRNA A1518/A1519 N6-dimethyltransferase RsmA/KsgA/DIM1 with predicted DNA glycosylase/AP lyase activity
LYFRPLPVSRKGFVPKPVIPVALADIARARKTMTSVAKAAGVSSLLQLLCACKDKTLYSVFLRQSHNYTLRSQDFLYKLTI